MNCRVELRIMIFLIKAGVVAADIAPIHFHKRGQKSSAICSKHIDIVMRRPPGLANQKTSSVVVRKHRAQGSKCAIAQAWPLIVCVCLCVCVNGTNEISESLVLQRSHLTE